MIWSDWLTIASTVLALLLFILGLLQRRKLLNLQDVFRARVRGTYCVMATLREAASDLTGATRGAVKTDIDRFLLRKSCYCAARAEAIARTQMQQLKAEAEEYLSISLPAYEDALKYTDRAPAPEPNPEPAS
jgi:heme exporter protein D